MPPIHVLDKNVPIHTFQKHNPIPVTLRLDHYLSTVGVIKRRTEAKRLADSGLISIRDSKVKAAHQIKPDDIIHIGGSQPVKIEVLALPAGSVRKDQREEYFRRL